MSPMMPKDLGAPLAFLVALTIGCESGGQSAATRGPTSAGASAAAETPVTQVRTAALPASPCGWLPTTEVTKVLGPLAGAPEPVRNAEDSTPRPDGTACRYRLARQPKLGVGAVSIEVTGADGVLYERVAGAMREHFATVLRDGKPIPRDSAPAAPEPAKGWDYTGHRPGGARSFTGRAGHVGVNVVSHSFDVTAEQLESLAASVRDRVPDLPFLQPPDPDLEALRQASGDDREPPPSGPDPCSLITRTEAEAVLGKLVVAPYRSSETTALVDPYGNGCTYFTAGHHAFTLKPHWNSGKQMFGMARGVAAMPAAAVPGLAGDREPADTLDGPWDQLAVNGTTGDLYFLAGERMLEVGYLTSSADAAGAVRLAGTALGRLKGER